MTTRSEFRAKVISGDPDQVELRLIKEATSKFSEMGMETATIVTQRSVYVFYRIEGEYRVQKIVRAG